MRPKFLSGPKKLTERDITKQIRAMLKGFNIWHWKAWQGAFSEPGVADILGAIRPSGRLFVIEVKRPGGKLSENQKKYLARAEKEGVLTIVAYCPEDVAKALELKGVLF